MPMPPQAVAQKRFLVRWRGYDPQEVEAFLRAVADDQQRLLEQIARLSARPAPRPADLATGDRMALLVDELARSITSLQSLTVADVAYGQPRQVPVPVGV